jgi:nicotinic acid mononucleotide adenylyltransferase
MTTKRIALFGLSANPPTGLSGHQGVVRLLTHCGQFDEVWVLPVYAHIYSSKRHLLVDFEDRFRMCELAFLPEATESCSVSISRLEKEVAEECLAIHGPEFRVGTVDLLEYLHNHYSVTIDRAEHKYYFVVAMDALCDIAAGKWKNVER